jgi:hypothetical protein
MNWFYLSESQEVGPLSVAALEEIHANGCIADETPVRREDSAEWEAYSTVFSSQCETHQNPAPPCDRPFYKFHCLHCQQSISAEEDCSGKTVQCPTCGGDFVVPQPPNETEPIDPNRGVSDQGQSPDMPSSQKKDLTYTAQAPGTSNSFGKQGNARPVVIKKGQGKSRFRTIATAAVIVTVVAIGALLLPKAKSNKASAKGDAPQIDLSDDINQTDKISRNEVVFGKKYSKEEPFVNSLGMRFVPVEINSGPSKDNRVLFSVWETRRQDYQKFTEEASGVDIDESWKSPQYNTDDLAPVIFIKIQDAMAFCKWLTEKERKQKLIPQNAEYRLPTDHEWSCAVGIGSRENWNESPKTKDGKITDEYPWGKEWPIPKKYLANDKITVGKKGNKFTENIPFAVGKLPPNSFGLHDMEGNVAEFCMIENRVALSRGASWGFLSMYFNAIEDQDKLEPQQEEDFKQSFYSSMRCIYEDYDHETGDLSKKILIDDESGCNDQGFRCVLVFENSQIELPNDINPTDKLSQDKAGDAPETDRKSNDSGPSLNIAEYARESKARDADKGFDYYDCKATYERLKRQQMVANGLKNKGMLNDDTEMFTVIILAIVNTDWSNCSPRLRERADKVKTTFELVGKKRATYGDLADSVKFLNEITDEVSKSASKNPMFLKNIPNIISDLEKDIYGDTTLEMKNKEQFDDSLTHASDSEQNNSDHGSNQHDSVTESTRTNRDSSEPPLAPLAVLRNSTIEEAKECVRLLDEELGKNPGNERASVVKTAIMDVFKSEASLIACVSGTKDAEEQYRIKMQNLQVASRPSPLTGRVNTTEVERIRREAEAIKTGSESRVRNAKSALKRTIEEARRSAPAPDREALSRVWDQIERRNNL